MITLDQISKSYGGVKALETLSVTFHAGQVCALLGPNGSGKSTTLKALVGLVRPTTGRITVDGLDLATHREEALERISYLPQRLRFPESLSGEEILSFYARLRGLAPDALLRAAAVAGLNGALQRPAGEYSGGMTQRLGLAVLSLPDAPVLLLDEPTAGLDPDGIRRFNDWLREQRQRGKTIVFTTHRLEDAEDLAERVLILAHGRLVADLTPQELRAREAVEVWLRISNWDERFRLVAEQMGAETLCVDERGDYIFSARGGDAIAVLERLRAEGAEVHRFASRSSIERFYHDATRET
jgi:Cu-processing system ATP-binding protein